MLFNSFVFIEFLCLFFLGWRFAKKNATVRYIYLICFSFLFYAWATPWWLLLLIGDGFIDYFAGLGMLNYPRYKKLFIGLSLTGNLGLLFFFKYTFFFGTNLNALFHSIGIPFQLHVVQLALPIGISFYTFQSLSYTISAYRGVLTPTRNILHFFAYISLWPQLVAGPIERAAELLPQLTQNNPVTEEQSWTGLNLIVKGYFKKMVLADNLAPIVNTAFGADHITHSMSHWWTISIMFAVQIYCDFSGYTDIARGMAKWLGYDFILNFNHPYGATSVREFWNRWHISLSSWFRDFVYIPLGGNRKGKTAGLRNMWITMLVSGFWHGAAWTFMMWGGLHAFYLTVERLTNWPEKLHKKPGGHLLSAAIVFGLVVIAWVFFRANNVSQALHVIYAMLDIRAIHPKDIITIGVAALFWLALGAGMLLNEFFGWSRHLNERSALARKLQPVGLAIVAVVTIFWRGPGGAFIYFQF